MLSLLSLDHQQLHTGRIFGCGVSEGYCLWSGAENSEQASEYEEIQSFRAGTVLLDT